MVCARSTWCVAAVVALGAALPGCGAFQAGVVGTFAPSLRRATSLPVSMRVERHLRTRLQASSLDREFHKKGTTWGTPPELRRVDPLDENTKNVIKFSVNALKGLITFLFQGEGREFARFYVLETVARVPYFSYLSILHLFESLGFHERAAWIKVHFAEADNELHHLLIMESLTPSTQPHPAPATGQAAFYFWICAGLYLGGGRAGYYVTQLIEEHAYQTYDTSHPTL
ncbi:alternative oxidase-domain-containing protein [Baffinella frigidus]|nr:alternative oxidase-domain-containing protein [Cryptophyta sp. CCMP2293]